MMISNFATTGLKGLDEILQDLRKGDNVVLQVDSIDDYLHFVGPYINKAFEDKKNLVYIRFAQHKPLIEESENVKIYKLDAKSGFEAFSKEIHNIITKEGVGAYYLFDCLTDLVSAWATDLMIGNFFMVTCPYLFKLDTIAYFSILRDNHSFKTIARIRETTQLLLDIYNFEGSYYVHPLKVWNRYSPTMFLPHEEKEGSFIPIINTVDATKLFSHMSRKSAEIVKRKLDYWDKLFIEAEEALKKPRSEQEKMFNKLCSVMIGNDKRMMDIVKVYFDLNDLIEIKARLIGTGYIGGKALGMLLARKILSKDGSNNWHDFLEPHDSFFIGSDVFYTYLVENGWWDLWMEQKTKEGYFVVAEELKKKMLHGKFPDEIKEQFNEMLEYFGQSPIIVRSSSLLEDGFGNAFAGKYESIFCVNQGTPEERYMNFEDIVRQVFASTMNEDALVYRIQKDLSQSDEQMALLVQRVSGAHHDHYFFPFIGGVGVSYNTFIWKKELDPEAGMVRLVMGLGTRAVNRVEGDYPRIASLDQPLLKPYAGMEDLRKFSQHNIDLLNKESNNLESIPLVKMLSSVEVGNMFIVGEKDYETTESMEKLGIKGEAWILSFDELLSKTEFPIKMRKILDVLVSAYSYPVDVEFTVNFTTEGKMQLNLLQCRPLQAKEHGESIKMPVNISKKDVLFDSSGNFMGGNIKRQIKKVIYIDTQSYIVLNRSDKYSIARLIGKLNKQVDPERLPTMLIGPGRWGTSEPSLGVPVHFAEINNMAVLCEVAYPKDGLMPELSFGSHFFLDLVEALIFYVALFPEEENVFFNPDLLNNLPNILDKLVPEDSKFSNVLKVFDISDKPLQLMSDISSQKVICLK